MPELDPIDAMREGEEVHVSDGEVKPADQAGRSEKGVRMKPTRWA